MTRATTRRRAIGYLTAGVAVIVFGLWRRRAAHREERPELSEKTAAPGTSLSGKELALCAAACDAILPKDEEPGALELGVVEFIDRWLARPGWRIAEVRQTIKGGLCQLEQFATERERKSWVDLTRANRTTLLQGLARDGGEGETFVRHLTVLTMEGALSDPSYGGNRERAGWKLVGFDMPCPSPSCK